MAWLQIAMSRIYSRIYSYFISQVFLMFSYRYTATDNKSNSITIDKDVMMVATFRTMEEQREVHESTRRKSTKKGQKKETRMGSRCICVPGMFLYFDYINLYMQLNRLRVYSRTWAPTITTTIRDGA